MNAWQRELLEFAVLYRLIEHDERISVLTDGTPYAFIDSLLQEMYATGTLKLDEDVWRPSKKGRRKLQAAMDMYEEAADFEVLATVNMDAKIPSGSRSGSGVKDEVYDPRFADKPRAQDLRIPVITWLREKGRPEASGIDPRRLVFVQMLEDGLLEDHSVWFDLALGTPQDEIEAIIDDAPSWTELGEKTIAEIAEAARLETLRRQGSECDACGAPLGAAEWRARATRQDIVRCPGCGASFAPPPPEEYECPQCRGTIHEGDARCSGCGAAIDFGLPEGTVTDDW